MNRKIAERYQRKKAILNGALKSYSKHGIDGMTMDNIASDSDFGKATIYYYFPSKEDIICSLMEMGWQDYGNLLKRWLLKIYLLVKNLLKF